MSDNAQPAQLSMDDVMDLVDMSTEDGWRDCCDRGIAFLAATHLPFTAADLESVGVPDPVHVNQVGPRFRIAARKGLIERVSYRPSDKPSGRGTVIAVWRGVRRNDDRGAA